MRVAPADRDLARTLERDDVRLALEGQLPEWLRPRRWFGGQTRHLTGARITGWLPLGDASASPAVLCAVRASDADGVTTRHPLFLAADTSGAVGEALESASTRAALLALLLRGGIVQGHGLRLIGEPLGAQGVEGLRADAPSRLVGAEQSNSSIVYGDRAILKVYRRLESGPNPEVELGLYLTAEAAFAPVPRVHATGRLVDDDGLDAALLILQAFVPNEGDGWAWALDRAGAALDASADAAGLARWFAEHEAVLAAVAELGRTTARLHAALALATAVPLQPRPTGAAELAQWGVEARQEAQATMAALDRSGLDDAALRRAIEAALLFTPSAIAAPGLQMRVHGDYHLGQVLRSADGWTILDFEGEPTRPLALRRRQQHPLIDVAGMVRSWGYAARAAATTRPAKEALADAWEAAVRARFLAAYWAEAEAAPTSFLPPGAGDRAALLRLFELSKALYEVRYELDNRPTMVGIPGSAVERLMADG